ncbi:hypothetical protein OKA04_22445 [Luteolibacter flavescens]|uniref:Uncharacterized protein n=1 Tax=Luteolibacter flavescens TaxID=1859460 RepID=A0ABT3FVB5_9BACT|nr:hypothetical protein [Luteolibacter flavescens]MCW1887513.1 hypothetical protein [Luteolibacter flavescens]
MKSLIEQLLARIYSEDLKRISVMDWACPVHTFGDLNNASIATVGLNPSNREFVDAAGSELAGSVRRFPTLQSLNLSNWKEASDTDIAKIEAACVNYFSSNPYDLWFKKLNELIRGTGLSYYEWDGGGACHLDLSPYATGRKWTALTPKEKSSLLAVSGDFLGIILRDSNVEALVLNGVSVVKNFEILSGKPLTTSLRPEWSLPRVTGKPVDGYSYTGVIEHLAGIDLGRSIKVYGYNHNIQSSYGITKSVINSIRTWLALSIDIQDHETQRCDTSRRAFELVG